MFRNIDRVWMISARREIEHRLRSNRQWLSKNWHLGRHVLRDCDESILRDEQALAQITKELKELMS